MSADWFEMRDVRRRALKGFVWIPLRSSHRLIQEGRFGFAGYCSEFYGVGSLAVFLDKRVKVEGQGWSQLGIGLEHSGYIQDDEYIPADVYRDYEREVLGNHLVLAQRGNAIDHPEWHLHQDFATTLGLKREGDTWVRPEEDYIAVARLTRQDGRPVLLEVRAAHLQDYLCARRMALYVTSYRDRDAVVEDASEIPWPEGRAREGGGNDRWEGHVVAIHEGGENFGAELAVFHVARTDVDPEEDVPTMGPPGDGNIRSRQWTTKREGRKLYRISGELWRNEWVEPGTASPIVRGDPLEPTVFFLVDAEGHRENARTLLEGRRWLWFRPEAVAALAERRGAILNWYTRDTGGIQLAGQRVHFGINSLGLVNVYAKDIALLPDWQQRIWAGHNVGPDGKVSAELLASQVDAEPARTHPPEAFLGRALSALTAIGRLKLGIEILRDHKDTKDIIERAHRFRSTDQKGLFALAKDIARLTADSIDEKQLHTIAKPPAKENWRGLKSLEKVLATKIGDKRARELMGPLVGVYELRLADAHLSGSQTADAAHLVGLDSDAPWVFQGYQLLHSTVRTLRAIGTVITDNW